MSQVRSWISAFTLLAGVPGAALAADWLPEWVPQSPDLPVETFDQACETDPRAFHDAPDSVSKSAATIPSANAVKVPAVPPEFRKAHPELRSASPFTAIVAYKVNETGRIAEARLIRSTGHVELDRAVLQAAEKWRLNAATLDGAAVCSWGRLAVTLKWTAN